MARKAKSVILMVVIIGLTFLLNPGTVFGNPIQGSTGDDPPPLPDTIDITEFVSFPRAELLEYLENENAAEPEFLTPRIVGGTEVSPENSYPWMVSLQFSDYHYCGGSLIGGDGVTAEWVLTEAHCWWNPSNGEPYDVSEDDTAVLGEHSLLNDSGNEIIRNIDAVYIHPNFNMDNLRYDIALLKLSEPVILGDYADAIKLSHTEIIQSTTGTVIGWGDTDYYGTSSDVLLETEIEVFSDDICSNYGIFFHPDTMLCAGTLDGSRDSCQGDSGSPLFFQDANNHWMEIGIVSWGYRCAEPGYPGVYTDLSQMSAWINKHLYYDCNNQSVISQGECEALVDLYASSDGPNWTQSTNWLSDSNDPCTWYGVTCTDDHVTDITLNDNNLTGYLLITIKKLTYLHNLNVENNNLIGDIPDEILDLVDIENLNIGGNHFTGGILANTNFLNSLQTLDLSSNQLSGELPEDLDNPELSTLKVNNNALTGPIPLSYADLSLDTFSFEDTNICETQNPEIQAWLSSITNLSSTAEICVPPSASFNTPAIEGYLARPRANIVVNATDAGSGMLQVEFYAFYDNAWNLIGTDINGADGWAITFGTAEISESTVSLKAVAVDNWHNETTILLNDIPIRDTYVFGNGYESRENNERNEAPSKSPYPADSRPYLTTPY